MLERNIFHKQLKPVFTIILNRGVLYAIILKLGLQYYRMC